MLISGVQPFTMLDYPGKSAAIVFTAGCNFRCGYCHNPEFVLPELLAKMKDSFIPTEAVFRFLDERRGLLEGVVVTGGEPTMHHDLVPFLGEIKRRGFAVKLDTNGNRPEVVAAALSAGSLDYIAMDYKTSLSEYQALAGALASRVKIKETVELIKQSGIGYEFRVTLVKELHSAILIEQMVKELAGARCVFLQQFRPATTLNPAFASYRAFSAGEMEAIAEQFRATVLEVAVRQ
ncbi:MAG: anaerobic ribonucleoside-triphosphate reductase activating protein [Candidatus Magasanikbacteria bacterium]|nr:anaerobic ribonucleoside-triphosphate reductase activating protein [Candidatus Magasanikbacteria bacterium]